MHVLSVHITVCPKCFLDNMWRHLESKAEFGSLWPGYQTVRGMGGGLFVSLKFKSFGRILIVS